MPSPDFMSEIKFNDAGLIGVIAQCAETGEVLMQAWMNAEALAITLENKQMCYWSRSRRTLWRKGESSGQTQELVELRLDCDGDCLLAQVRQAGVACHTGRRSCFFRLAKDEQWVTDQAVVVPPETLYRK